MPALEPNHFWPADLDKPEPAKEVTRDQPPLPGQHVTPFEMTDGASGQGGRRFLFETTFYETPTEEKPDPKAQTAPAVNPETIRLSLDE